MNVKIGHYVTSREQFTDIHLSPHRFSLLFLLSSTRNKRKFFGLSQPSLPSLMSSKSLGNPSPLLFLKSLILLLNLSSCLHNKEMGFMLKEGNGGGGSYGGAGISYGSSTRRHPYTHISIPRPVLFPLSYRNLHVVSAKRFQPRTGKMDDKNRRSNITTKDPELQDSDINRLQNIGDVNNYAGVAVDDGFVMPKLPGDEPDFWEGSHMDALGFFVEYMWAFGLLFAAIACLLAATSYNEGATDFKETPAYKESIESRDLLEEPEASNPDVFESNPTEVAPSLE